MSAVGRVALVALLAVTGYYAFLFFAQRHFIYPAPRGPVHAPPIPGVIRHDLPGARDTVQAWFAPPPDKFIGRRVPVIVFAHGNAERAEDWIGQFRELQLHGIGVLIVEYPGYGVSAGSPSQSSITDAMLTAYDWLRQQPSTDTTRIIAYGRSLGGGAATRLAGRRPVAALILESSFTSLRAFAGQFLAPGFLVRDPFDNQAELRRYRGPLLVLHGQDDRIAPFSGGQALARAVPGSQFVALPCGHNDCERPWGAILAFLRSHRILDGPDSSPVAGNN